MATAPIFANDAGAPVGDLEAIPLDDTYMIRADQIDLGERLRPIDEVWAHALGAMMARDGQRTAIEVCRLPGAMRWTIVTGGHRLVGAQHAEMEYLRAQVVGANRHERLMSEVLENLARRDLDPIDRAAFIAELVTLHKVKAGIDPNKDGRAASIQARWQKQVKDEAADTNDTMSFVYGWSQEVADSLGFNKRTIERDLLLYRRLAPSLVARLREARHPLAANAAQLRALTKLEPSKQEQVVDLLLDGWNGKVGDAIAKVTGSNRAIRPDHKRLSTFIGTFKRMEISEKKGVLFHLAPLLPAGMKLVEDGNGLTAALDAAFKVLVQLGDGEPVEDEDIHDACGLVQSALMALNAATVPAAVLATPRTEPVAEPAPVPAVAIRASVKPDYLVCLECGEKHAQLKRHLSKHALDADSYIAKWRLPLDYPFTAPNVSEARRQAAQKLGLRSGAKPGEAK